MTQAMTATIERWLVRVGILASDEESEYYAWADQRLDELEREARTPAQRAADDRAWLFFGGVCTGIISCAAVIVLAWVTG